ncbi:hypothetical protein CK203_116338 [Vitis vinifera]|uniref:Uncharacterized protein n=1 Tax=Vitis vinifera TaxID=29760 RepID=A0A438C9B8_VITVI|nr:hypothetical protein CK203_116338 [Vitis vinifera]
MSTIRGIDIKLSPESIYHILDIPSVGLRVYKAKTWPTVSGFEPKEAIQSSRRHPMAPGLGDLSTGQGSGTDASQSRGKAEIREMEDGLDPQRDFEQRGPELDIPPPPHRTIISAIIYRASSHKLPSQAPHVLDHAPWMDVSAQISSLGTHIEELTLVHDTHFYSMVEHIDQGAYGSAAGYIRASQQSIDHIESRQASQHEEMMAYLRSMFPLPPPRP